MYKRQAVEGGDGGHEDGAVIGGFGHEAEVAFGEGPSLIHISEPTRPY